jgi:hypothetical protein
MTEQIKNEIIADSIERFDHPTIQLFKGLQ